ncbi:MAG: ABC transporter ATP-binding protein [Clostridiales Family XIII bacterium]|jgi:oligopeptide/dipeptide ABC transporter ATP-binding protein|nr:ABC transporter ATP-binding protein [Clostridiales Family XIII bacterium]
MKRETLIRAAGLKTYYINKRDCLGRPVKVVKAVDNVNFDIRQGETLGVVGESGCGKSTLGRTLIKLIEPTGGEILFRGKDLAGLSAREMLPLRPEMQIVFQDPYASLNPMRTVYDAVREPLGVMKYGAREDRPAMVAEALATVGLSEYHYHRFPHELSGGQRQRVAIARAIITRPGFIVCDEPVSALDASVRAQVLNLIRELQAAKNLTYLFISHDMSVIRYVSDRVVVMYLGKIVELAEKEELFKHPVFPYTKVLLSAIPIPDVRVKAKRLSLEGEIASPLNPPPGCRLKERCPYAGEICGEEDPGLRDIGGGHLVACHRLDAIQ